jgi:enoyl-CoA hydratase
VTGAGRAFSAAATCRWSKTPYRDYDEIVRILEEARDLVYNILHCHKPIISAINGPAVGAGLVVALLADISIAGESARLADGHLRMGVAAGDHAAIVWPLLCGMAKSKYYLLTSDFVGGREAERIGLVSLCVPDEELLERAAAVATDLATGPRHAIQFTKRALNQWLLDAGPIFDHSLALEMLGFFSPDMMAGVEALRRKEKPQFPSNEEWHVDSGPWKMRSGKRPDFRVEDRIGQPFNGYVLLAAGIKSLGRERRHCLPSPFQRFFLGQPALTDVEQVVADHDDAAPRESPRRRGPATAGKLPAACPQAEGTRPCRNPGIVHSGSPRRVTSPAVTT